MKVSRVHKLFRSLSDARGVWSGWCTRTCCVIARERRGRRRRGWTRRRCCSATRRHRAWRYTCTLGAAPARRRPQDGRAVRRRAALGGASGEHRGGRVARGAVVLVRACGASCCATHWMRKCCVELGWDAEAQVVRRVVEHPSFGLPECEVEGCEGLITRRGNVCTDLPGAVRAVAGGGPLRRSGGVQADPARAAAGAGADVRGVLRAAGSRAAGAPAAYAMLTTHSDRWRGLTVDGVRRARGGRAVADVRCLPTGGLRTAGGWTRWVVQAMRQSVACSRPA